MFSVGDSVDKIYKIDKGKAKCYLPVVHEKTVDKVICDFFGQFF